MNTRILRYFVAIADVGSFTGAAAALSIAQPALTRRMRELEMDFSTELFLRHPRGVVLTPAGVTFYEAAKRILAEEEKLRQKLMRGKASGSASLVLGAPPTLARLLFPGLLDNCARRLEGIRLGTREAFTSVLLEALERGTVDMAVVTNPDFRQKLSFQPLLSEPFALISHARMNIPQLLSIDQLARLPILMTSLHLRLVERQLLMLGKELNVAMEIDSVDAIREMLCCGDWATIMPVSVFKDDHSRKTLTMSNISGVQLNRQLALATRTESNPGFPAALVQDLLKKQIERLASKGHFSFPA